MAQRLARAAVPGGWGAVDRGVAGRADRRAAADAVRAGDAGPSACGGSVATPGPGRRRRSTPTSASPPGPAASSHWTSSAAGAGRRLAGTAAADRAAWRPGRRRAAPGARARLGAGRRARPGHGALRDPDQRTRPSAHPGRRRPRPHPGRPPGQPRLIRIRRPADFAVPARDRSPGARRPPAHRPSPAPARTALSGNRSARECRSRREGSGRRRLLGDAGRVEGGHVAQGLRGALHDGQGEQRAGALAEPHAQVEQRAQPEVVQREPVAGLGRAVPGQAVAGDRREPAPRRPARRPRRSPRPAAPGRGAPPRRARSRRAPRAPARRTRPARRSGRPGRGGAGPAPRRSRSILRASVASSMPVPRPVAAAGSAPVKAQISAAAAVVLAMPMSPVSRQRCPAATSSPRGRDADLDARRVACSRVSAGPAAQVGGAGGDPARHQPGRRVERRRPPRRRPRTPAAPTRRGERVDHRAAGAGSWPPSAR